MPPLTFVCMSTLFCSFCSSRAADLTSSFLAAIWRAGRRTFPFVSCSSSTLTTRSCPCCRATARGVNPSYKQSNVAKHVHHKYSEEFCNVSNHPQCQVMPESLCTTINNTLFRQPHEPWIHQNNRFPLHHCGNLDWQPRKKITYRSPPQ